MVADGPQSLQAEELLDRAQKGDPDALTKLIELHKERLRRVAAKWPELVEPDDLVQEVTLKLLIYFAVPRKKVDNFRAFITRVAMRIGFDLWRAARKRKQAGDPLVLQAPQTSPEQQAHHNRVMKFILDYCSDLPPLDCQILLLHFKEGLGRPAIAAELGVTGHKVRTVIRDFWLELARKLPDILTKRREPDDE